MSTELNIENPHELLNYLRNGERIGENTKVHISQLTGGISNRTVLLNFDDGSSWVMKQALDKLRVDGDWFCSPERIFYEAEAMRWLEQYVAGNSPRLIFEDQSEYVLAMEAVQPPFENLKTLLINSPPKSSYFSLAGKLLGQIHLQGSKKENHIPHLFKDTHFFQSLRIEPYYLETIKKIEKTRRFFETLIDDTNKDHFTVVHGDFSPKNILVKRDKLILLDHEVTHFGDGTFDLGFFIAHLLSKANHLPEYRSEFISGVLIFIEAYLDQTKVMTKYREQRTVRHSIGCFLARVCGLSQLEYLSEQQRLRQEFIAMRLLSDIPWSIDELTIRFKDLMDA